MPNYLSSKPLMIISLILLLLFSTAVTTLASPFISNPENITLFVSGESLDGGTNHNHLFQSYQGTNLGVAIPVGSRGTLGFIAAQNPDNNYCFYEVFANIELRNNSIMGITVERLNDDGVSFHLGAFRKLPIDSANFSLYLGPGIAVMSAPASFEKNNDWSSASLFVEAKANYNFTENLFMYGTGLFDFSINSSKYELGMGFSY